jgi:hypothetical protein
VITNSIRQDLATTGAGAAVGSSLVVASEAVQGWAKAGSAVVGFLILCVTLVHASVKLVRYINSKP